MSFQVTAAPLAPSPFLPTCLSLPFFRLKIREHEARIASLRTQEATLQRAMVKHLGLQTELEHKLERCEDRLARIEGTPEKAASTKRREPPTATSQITKEVGESQVAETEKKSEDSPTEQRHDADKNNDGGDDKPGKPGVAIAGAKTSLEEEVANSKTGSSKSGPGSASGDQDSTKALELANGQERRRTETPPPYPPGVGPVKDDTASKPYVIKRKPPQYASAHFLKANREHGLMVLLGGIRAKEMIQRFMDVTALETIALDKKMPDGKHRRESLAYTCLWQPQAEPNKQAKKRISKRKKMETTKGSADDPIEILLGEEDGEEERDPSSLRQDKTSPVDPDIPLCPYELSGECADPYCQFQHLRPRSVASKDLAKESMRLPTLRLPERSEDNRATNKRSRPTTITGGPSKKARIEQPIATTTEQSDSKDADNDFGDDFLALPTVPDPVGEAVTTLTDERSVIDLVDDDDENETGPKEPSSDSTCVAWWTPETKEEVANNLRGQPVTRWMSGFFDFDIDANDTMTFRRDDWAVDGGRGFIRLIGRLIDASRVAHHAGRLDLFRGLWTLVSIVSREERDEEHNSKAKTNFYGAFAGMSSKMVGVCHLGASSKSAIQQAWEIQSSLALMSAVVRCLHECLGASQVSDNLWETILVEISTPYQTTKVGRKRMSSLQEEVQKSTQKGQSQTAEKEYLGAFHGILTSLRLPPAETKANNFTRRTLSAHLQKEKSRSKSTQVGKLSSDVHSLIAVVRVGNALFTGAGEESAGCTSDLTAHDLEDVVRLESNWLLETAKSVHDPFLLTMLAPLTALRVNLFVSMQKYNKAQKCIEQTLGVTHSCGVAMFSDLLWCQLVQLRANLPFASGNTATELHDSTKTDHGLLSSSVCGLGIHLNYLTLCGDRNMTKAFASRKVLPEKLNPVVSQSIINFLKQLNHAINPSPNTPKTRYDGTLNLQGLAMSAESTPGGKITIPPLAFPRSLLLGGSELSSLILDNCGIQNLPVTFGSYFPKLKVRREPTKHRL